ncbi:hypothetical protein H4I96_01816 [Botrytis cinerea]
MPFQKTGSRSKQMIFHRESNSADGFFEYDRNTSNRQSESLFWISENPKSDKPAVRRNTAIMARKPPEIRIDPSQTAQSPPSPLHFDWGFNDNSASGSMGKGVDESVGGQGNKNKSTPNLTKVESTPIGDDVGSLSPTISKSKSCVSLRNATRTLQPSPINDSNQHRNRDAPLATQAQTCSNTGMVFSEKEIPQQAQGNSDLRLHSYKREAQATSIPSIPKTPSATKKLIRSTKSYDRFILRSKEKSFFHFHSHHNTSHQHDQRQQQQLSPNKKAISTSASCSNLQKMVEFTDNVEQLIRETDEAFQAAGFAIAKQPKITGMTLDDLHNMNVKNINNSTVTRQNRSTYSSKPLARTNSISKRNQMQNSNFLKERPSSTSLSGKSPVPKSSFNSKAKKSISPKQKKNTALEKASRKSLPHPHSSARWNLGDVTASMADVFKGKFTRLEADEMLTPDRLQQLEEKAEKAKLDNERKASLENAQSEAARNADTVKDADAITSVGHSRTMDADKKLDTNIVSSDNPESVSPTEPFHLEHLLPRINNDKDKTPTSAQILGPSSPLPFTSADVSESSENDQRRGRKALSDVSNPDYAEIDAIEQAFEDLNFPSPPRDSPHSPPRLPRSRSNTGMTSLLPTIPEISPLNILAPRTPERSFSQDSEYSQDSSTSSVDYIQLPSTLYTLTSPLFRHGPIRLEHAYHRSNRDSLSAPDLEEALDWTAFQMAISGTMDDGTLGASQESIWEADEAEVDSIFDWWSGFGYPGIGRLVKEAPVSRRKKVKSLAAADAEKCLRKNKDGRDNRATTIGLGLGFGTPSESSSGGPRTPEYQGGLWIETIRDSAPQVVESVSIPTLGARRDVALKVNVPEPRIDDDEDNDSLPPSPINLVKIKDEYIPMGYNLGHDLGIF